MSYTPSLPFAHTSGPRVARTVLVGEAWGEREEALGGRPFAGASGQELFRMLGEAMPEVAPALHAQVCEQMRYGDAWMSVRDKWLAEAGILLTNVLALRPPGNNLEALCVEKKQLPVGYIHPALSRGKYLRTEYLAEVERLGEEITQVAPNIVVAMGNTACWALLLATNIGTIRGAVTTGPSGGAATGLKILPTYHPAAVLRQWQWRPIVVTDLVKARRESAFPELRRHARRVLVDPTLGEVQQWTREVLSHPGRVPYLSPDIETASGQITCIGFARDIDDALVVPFFDKRTASWSYWPTGHQEAAAWECVARLLESPIPKVGQNFIYDLQYITRMGIRPRNCLHDTMLLHHSIFPEMQKGLGFLGSVYTNESAWKLMRKRKADTEKKDE